MTEAEEIVQSVLYELKSRGGFDWWWDEIDPETKQSIKDDMTISVEAILNRYT